MKRIFIDSSVFFSAANSAGGHSRDLFMMAARGEIMLVVSDLVLAETRENLEESAPDFVPLLDLLLEVVPLELVRPTKSDVVAAARLVALKDAPILAAAKKAGVDLLVTLDKRHLLEKPELVRYAGVEIVTPKQAVDYLHDVD
jgi:predicted nucleic acid-binding protein